MPECSWDCISPVRIAINEGASHAITSVAMIAMGVIGLVSLGSLENPDNEHSRAANGAITAKLGQICLELRNDGSEVTGSMNVLEKTSRARCPTCQ
jgi:hypothetical protein